MTMPQLGTLLVAVIIAFCALIGFLVGAPKGYEDETGFHEEKDTKAESPTSYMQIPAAAIMIVASVAVINNGVTTNSVLLKLVDAFLAYCAVCVALTIATKRSK